MSPPSCTQCLHTRILPGFCTSHWFIPSAQSPTYVGKTPVLPYYVFLLCHISYTTHITTTITQSTIFTTHLLTKCREVSHQHTILDTSRASENWTQIWHYLPGDSIRFHILRSQFHKTASPAPPHRLEVPTTVFPGLINFLEWLIKLRETLYLLLPVIIKEYNTGTIAYPDGRDE